jgi:hypothetical protein
MRACFARGTHRDLRFVGRGRRRASPTPASWAFPMSTLFSSESLFFHFIVGVETVLGDSRSSLFDIATHLSGGQHGEEGD